jgi:arginine repressor
MSDKIPQELTDQYKSPHQRKVIKRRAIIRDMVSQNKSAREIMAELAEQNAAVSKAMVYRELKEMGLKARPVKPGRTATADDGDGSDKSTQKTPGKITCSAASKSASSDLSGWWLLWCF